VHGIGRQQRGDQLDDVVEPMVEFLGEKLGRQNVQLAARTGRADGHQATARIRVTPGTGEPDEEWDVREAWWAQTFKPSDDSTVLGWAVRAFVAHIASTWQNVFLRNIKRLAGKHVPVQGLGEGVWQIPVAGLWVYYLIDAIAWVLITVGYLLVYVAGAVLIVPLYVFLLLPGAVFWPQQVAGVQRALVNMLSGGIGEQQAITNRHVAVAAAASIVTLALRPFLDPEWSVPSGITYDTVTVVAHSGGCIVSYEALAGEDVKAWCAASGRRVTWMTIGSGLNLGWRLRAKNKDRDKAFWSRRIDGHVNWINVYARYDPVPQGEPPRDMVQALTGADPRAQLPWLNVRVANQDWPLTDHTTYWGNREEVTARIVHAVSCSKLANEALDSVRGSCDPGSAIDTAAAMVVEREGARHRRRVTLDRATRLGPGLALFVLLIVFCGGVRDLGGAIVSGLGFSWPAQGVLHRIAENLPHAIGAVSTHDVAYWLVGVIVVVYGAIGIAIVAGLIASYVSWRQDERDDVAPTVRTL
jgi:hypothetical protein